MLTCEWTWQEVDIDGTNVINSTADGRDNKKRRQFVGRPD